MYVYDGSFLLQARAKSLAGGEREPDKRSRQKQRTLFMRTLLSSVASSVRTMQTVERPFFPFTSTVSPRKRFSSSILAADSPITGASVWGVGGVGVG